MDAAPGEERRTTCPYCGVGCGVLARPDGAGGLDVRGDPDHPANYGRLCSKGSALGETVGLGERLLSPQIRGRKAGWDEALDEVAYRFGAAVAEHGPDSVALYVSGQLLTEDYYVANKLMKGFIGSANIDTNSRLCMASSVAGHRRAFGTDTVPGLYEDLDLADLVVLTGSNLAWCHPVLYQRLAEAKAARPSLRVVVIDPRETATTRLADLHLPVAPGGDVAIFNALLAAIDRAGAIDRSYAEAHVAGLADALAAAHADDPTASGVDPELLAQFCALWIGTERVVTVYSQGVNQSSAGTDKVGAILNCHLATGRIGLPGMGPFSVTGQPNAMGGREVGGLANMLACHLDLENAEHRAAVAAFWDAPRIADQPGLKAVEMFRAVAEGRIKALWIMCTNPAVSLPEAGPVAAAIAACPFVAVSDLTGRSDTARLANVLLPATGWGEKDGTVTNSDRTISRQRAVLPAPGAARADWWQLAEVGKRLGWKAAFDYAGPAEIFREHAALSGVAGRLGRDFDVSALSDLSDAGYDALVPVTWPVSAARRGGRFFAEGGFYHPDGRARMVAVRHRAPATEVTQAYPLRLNTGRVRDHWHTMTRTALSPRLSRHIAEPFVEVHPADAARAGLAAAEIARVESPHGRALLRVLISDRAQPGSVFVPMHWTGETASAARANALVPAVVDPLSGQPESKAGAVRLRPAHPAWYGYAVARQRPAPASAYWARARTATGWQVELAGAEVPGDWVAMARGLFALDGSAEMLSFRDPARGLIRFAFVVAGRLEAAFFAAPAPVAVVRAHLIDQIGQPPAPGLLSGQPGADREDPGALVCSCNDVGVNTIRAAIAAGADTVAAVTEATCAGGGCGACRPEIAALIADGRPKVAAE